MRLRVSSTHILKGVNDYACGNTSGNSSCYLAALCLVSSKGLSKYFSMLKGRPKRTEKNYASSEMAGVWLFVSDESSPEQATNVPTISAIMTNNTIIAMTKGPLREGLSGCVYWGLDHVVLLLWETNPWWGWEASSKYCSDILTVRGSP